MAAFIRFFAWLLTWLLHYLLTFISNFHIFWSFLRSFCFEIFAININFLYLLLSSYRKSQFWLFIWLSFSLAKLIQSGVFYLLIYVSFKTHQLLMNLITNFDNCSYKLCLFIKVFGKTIYQLWYIFYILYMNSILPSFLCLYNILYAYSFTGCSTLIIHKI